MVYKMKESNKENIDREEQIQENVGYVKEEVGDVNTEPVNVQSKLSQIEIDFLLASCNCDFRSISTILTKNPDLVNMKSPIAHGFTALHFACKFGATDVIRSLVGNFGAKVDIISYNGKTPLHVAVEFKKEDAIKLLLSQYGANKTVRDYNGSMPADLITGDGMESIMQLVGPSTADQIKRPTKGLKKGFQSIGSATNSDNSSRGFFSFRKGSENVATLGSGHHQNHLAPGNQMKEGGHSMPYSLHAPDINSIKKSLSFMSSRPPTKSHSAVRGFTVNKDDEHRH